MTKSLSPCKNLFVKQRRRRFMKQLYFALIAFSFGNLVDAVPKIIDSSENTNTYYGSKITLFCTSEGSPMPNITWSKSRSKIREIPNKIEINTKVLTSVKVKSVLTIKNICEKCNLQKKGETIKYTCQVGKGVAVSRKKISVFINPKPKAPVINSSRVISNSAILIRWKAVKLVSKPVLHYTIHFNADGEKTSSMENISTTNDEIIEYIIGNLIQLTTYSIFITATNEFGEGEASELLIEKTKPLEPQPPHMSVDHSTYQNISLSLKPSSKNKRRILEYQIFVEAIDGKTTNEPLPLPKVYGNDSFKSKHNIYAAARFEGNKLPTTFILGDGKWYDYRFNKELQPLEKYRIYVRALAKNYTNKNIVVFGKPFYLTAETQFPKVPKLIVIETSEDWAKFEWRKLKSEKIYYKVIVKDEGGEIQESVKVEKNSLKFKGLKEKKTYKAYLRVCTSTKDCKESEGIEFKMDSTSSSPTLIIVIVVGIVAVLVIVIIAVIFFMRRRKKHKQDIIKNNKMDSLLESKAPRNGSSKHLSEDQIALIETKENGHIVNENELKPLRAKPLSGSEESTTDPRTEWECSKSNIKILNEMEQDCYGKICKGSVRLQKDEDHGSVLLRILKEKSSESLKDEFLSIMETMKKVPVHNGIVNLLGCITKEEPITMIMEYVPHGDLLGYMRNSRGIVDIHYKEDKSRANDLTSFELMSFAEQIASAMAHLERHNIMHGDLAARNVMVDRQGLCKLSGIGENHLIFDKNTYGTRKKDRLVIKWAAIEVIKDKVRTIQSDVWSYGVLLYEIATIGGSPYAGKDEHWLMDMLKDDYRMPCPEHVSEALYSVMLDCWRNDPSERPNFEKLLKVMRTLSLMNKHQDHINIAKYDGELFSKLDDVKC